MTEEEILGQPCIGRVSASVKLEEGKKITRTAYEKFVHAYLDLCLKHNLYGTIGMDPKYFDEIIEPLKASNI